jgi:hypothetical protein
LQPSLFVDEDRFPVPVVTSTYELRPSLVVEDTVFGHQERGRRRANANRRRGAQLNDEERKAIEEYLQPGSKVRVNHLMKRFGWSKSTAEERIRAGEKDA